MKDETHNAVVRLASNEPVAVAGLLRAVIYSLLGARGLDPSVLALIVVVAETLVSVVLRRFVSPLGREVAEAAAQQLAPAAEAVSPSGQRARG